MIIKNSMLYWFEHLPKEIPTPETDFILCSYEQFVDMIDKGVPLEIIDTINDIAFNVLGKARNSGYPLFIRTDLCSAKHDWNESCFISNIEEIPLHAYRIVDVNLTNNLFPQAFVVREYIKMNSSFTAFTGMPISKEMRVFVEQGKILCHHPYWPEDAIKNPSIDDWKERLKKLNEVPLEIKSILYLSERIAKHSHFILNSWSIDWCQGKDGKWWMIDMALAEDSYHYPHKKVL